MSEHKPTEIKGYRGFTPETTAKINKIKEMEVQVAALWKEIQQDPEVDQRLMSLAKTNIQDSFHWFVRAVAKPADPFV